MEDGNDNEVDYNWTIDNEEQTHALTQPSVEGGIIINDIISNAIPVLHSQSKRSSVTDSDSLLFDNILSNPDMLQRFKKALVRFDSLESSSNNTYAHDNAVVIDTETNRSSVDPLVQHHVLTQQFSKETRAFLLTKYTDEIVQPLINIRNKLLRLESNKDGLAEAMKHVTVNSAYMFEVDKILSKDIPPSQYEYSKSALLKHHNEVKQHITHFHQVTKNVTISAFNAAEADLLEKLNQCPRHFLSDALPFLNSSARPKGLTASDNVLIFEVAKVGLATELLNSSQMTTTPSRLLCPALNIINSTIITSSRPVLSQVNQDRHAKRDEFVLEKRRKQREERALSTSQWQQAEEVTTTIAVFFHNISLTSLTNSEIKLLNNGLKFIVAPPCAPDTIYLQAFDRLARSIRLRYNFLTNNTGTKPNSLYIPNPEYVPPQASCIIERYISTCHTDLLNLLEKYPAYYTTDKEQRHVKRVADTLKSKQLIIKPADKNLGPVVMSITQYNRFCLDILQDVDTYRIVTDLPSVKTQFASLAEILNKLNISLTSNLAKFLLRTT